MNQNIVKVSFHLINEETINAFINIKTNTCISDFLDENIEYLKIHCFQGTVIYINKKNILYIEVSDKQISYSDIQELIGDYIHEDV